MHFADNRSKIGRYVPSFVFIIFIFGMAIWFMFSPKADYSSSEKRYLQKFPNTTLETVSNGTFGSEFEKYFADHFPDRNLWVGLNAYYTLNTGNNGANNVYSCKNDYLINKPVSTDNQLSRNFGIIAEFKNMVNVPTTVLLAPSTGYVCDDVLPMFHNRYEDDKYFAEAQNVFSQNGIGFVDVRNEFKSAYKNGSQLYYRTDHHWTTEGAYTAYEKLCESLNVTKADRNKFAIERYDGFYGTTYSTSGFWLIPPDTVEVWNNKQNTSKNINVKITEADGTKEYGSMFFYDHTKKDDKYPVFIDGNHALTEITNTNAKGGTILVVKDSFSHSMAPFLAESFSKVILVDMRYYKQNVSEIVKQQNPNQILFLYGIDNLATDTDIAWLQ